VVPVLNLGLQSLLHRRGGSVNPVDGATANLFEVRPSQLHPVIECLLLQVIAHPPPLDNRSEQGQFILVHRPIVEIRSPSSSAGHTFRVNIDELEAFGDHPASARGDGTTVDYGVLEVHQNSRRLAGIGFVNQHGSLSECRVMTLDDEVDRAVEQRMARSEVLG